MQWILDIQKNKCDKKIHDILPACCILDNSICDWKQVEMFCETLKNGNQWGSKLSENTNTFISINYHKEKFEKCLIYGI